MQVKKKILGVLTVNGVGHLSRKCLKPRKTKYTKQVESDSASEDDDRFTLFSVYHTSGKGADKYRVNVQIGTVPINMEIDTGSAVTIISEDIYEKHLSEYPVRDANIRLKSYSGDKISLLGQCDVPVSYQGNEPLTLPLYIAKGHRPPLFRSKIGSRQSKLTGSRYLLYCLRITIQTL